MRLIDSQFKVISTRLFGPGEWSVVFVPEEDEQTRTQYVEVGEF